MPRTPSVREEHWLMQMNAEGMTPRAIRVAIDRKYADLIEKATPTPYPPA